MEQPGLAQWSNPAWRADLHLFFTLYGKVGSDDPTRQCSNRTQALRRDVLGSTFSLLKSRNRGVRTLSQLTPRHIPEIIDIWSEALPSGQPRQLPSTQVANFSVLRWFWKLHGIKTDPIATYITDPLRRTLYTREMVANRDKSWEGNGVDVEEIIKLARDEDPVLERLIIMARDFGLRAREALSMNPHESDGGDRLRVLHGAKGGREREIRFDPFGHGTLRGVLDELREKNPEGVRGWDGLTMEQSRQRLYYLMRKIGLTRKQLGVTLHGLRTQFAIDNFERLSGAKAAVRGGATIDYRQLDELCRKISQAMGHNRIRLTSAYYGSFDKMAKVACQRFLAAWEKLQSALPDIQQCVIEHGMDNLWLVGPLARGEATANPTFEFLVDGPDTAALARRNLTWALTTALRKLVEPAIGAPVALHFVVEGLDASALVKGAVPLLEPTEPCLAAVRPEPSEEAEPPQPEQPAPSTSKAPGPDPTRP